MNVAAIDRYLAWPLSVLALWEPWGILLVASDPDHDGEPPKRHETRHWAPRNSLPFCIAVHASKKFDKENREPFTSEPYRRILKRCGYYPGDPREFVRRGIRPPGGLKPVPLGAIVGLATVVEVVPTGIDTGFGMTGRFTGADADDHALGSYGPNRYAWRCADAIPLPEPIAHTGRQDALYPLDRPTRDEIDAQLRAMRTAA